MKLIASVALLFCASLQAQSLQLLRVVEDTKVISSADPVLTIKVPDQATYVGGNRWLLYGIADCEVHVFVEADASRRVRRLYWLQFESYLPEHPDLKHIYNDPLKTTLGGFDFYVRSRFGLSSEPPRAGSDNEKVQQLLNAARYSLPAEMMNVRLVHLFDEKARRELMLIYAEDLGPTGLTVTKLAEGNSQDRWMSVSRALLDRAKGSFLLTVR